MPEYTIPELIQLMAEKGEEVYSKRGTVKSVDKENNTIVVTPLDDSSELTGVQLMAAPGGKYKFYPKVNSIVTVDFLDINNSICSQFSEIDIVDIEILESVTLKTKDIILEADSIIINGGENEGLVIIQKLVDKINAIEEAHNNFLNEYKMHNHLHPQGSTTAFVVPSTQQPIQQTQKADIENDKFKH